MNEESLKDLAQRMAIHRYSADESILKFGDMGEKYDLIRDLIMLVSTF